MKYIYRNNVLSYWADVVLVSDQPRTNVRDDVIKWKHFPRYWPFVRGIHRSPVNSQHKGQWRGAFNDVFFDLRLNKRLSGAGYLRHQRAHDDVIVMVSTTASRNDTPAMRSDEWLISPKTILQRYQAFNQEVPYQHDIMCPNRDRTDPLLVATGLFDPVMVHYDISM